MESESAMDFYERVVEGTKNYKTISLEHKTGASLDGVEMHPVDKKTLASVIERLPESMFEAVEEAEGDAEEAEELAEQEGDLSAVNEETVEAFEDLAKASLKHNDLASSAMKDICGELSFEVLFDLGTEIIDMSVEETGTVRGFQEQA